MKLSKKENKKINLKKHMNNKEKITLIVYFVLRLLVIICMVSQGMNGNWNNVFLCILTLLMFTIPNFIANKLNIELPSLLEIVVYLFIYASEILGEIQNFYGLFAHWDTILHTLNGFLCAAVGFSLVDLLNRDSRIKLKMSPIFLSIVAICFSMTIGVLWEFFEFGVDRYLLKDMQKDRIVQVISSVKINEENENVPVVIDNIDKTVIYSNNSTEKFEIEGGYLELGVIDTMKDLLVNLIGAIIFSILGYLYVKDRDEYKIIEKLLLTKTKN